MARPRKCRRICHLPREREFIPSGTPGGEVALTLDELETLRLLDVERLTQEQCALQMGVARATAALIYDRARAKVAEALVYGKSLRIGGGDVTVCEHAGRCCGRCGAGRCPACRERICGRRPESFCEKGSHDNENCGNL